MPDVIAGGFAGTGGGGAKVVAGAGAAGTLRGSKTGRPFANTAFGVGTARPGMFGFGKAGLGAGSFATLFAGGGFAAALTGAAFLGGGRAGRRPGGGIVSQASGSKLLA